MTPPGWNRVNKLNYYALQETKLLGFTSTLLVFLQLVLFRTQTERNVSSRCVTLDYSSRVCCAYKSIACIITTMCFSLVYLALFKDIIWPIRLREYFLFSVYFLCVIKLPIFYYFQNYLVGIVMFCGSSERKNVMVFP